MLKNQKSFIRDKYIKTRNKINNRNILERNLNNNIISFFESQRKLYISGYFAVRGEVSINQSLCELNTCTNVICVPKIYPRSKNLIFISWKNNNPLKKGTFDIPVPIYGEVITPNYLLVPLVAFDQNKNRLGYGGGYYDTTINTLKKKNKQLVSIGIAYDQQFYPNLPTERFDQRLDYIITESKVIS